MKLQVFHLFVLIVLFFIYLVFFLLDIIFKLQDIWNTFEKLLIILCSLFTDKTLKKYIQSSIIK